MKSSVRLVLSRPVPAVDEGSAPYWEAAAEHTLVVAQCSHCSHYVIPPDHTCSACGSTDPRFTFEAVSGRGHVRSWTTVRQSFLPGFDDDLPYLLVDVELIEQPELRIIGRLLDGPDSVLKIGDPVTVAFEDISPDLQVPAFELSGKS